MVIVKNSPVFAAALEKIPHLIAEIVQWETETGKQFIKETVCEYASSGNLTSTSHFCISADDLLDHIRRAKKFPLEYEIEASETVVTVTRHLKGNRKFIATYTPIVA